MENLKDQLARLYKQKEDIQKQIDILELKIQNSVTSYITLKDAIYINRSHLSRELTNHLKELATFENPQVKLLQSLRKPL